MNHFYYVTSGVCIEIAYLLSKKTLHNLLKIKKQFVHHVRDHETR